MIASEEYLIEQSVAKMLAAGGEPARLICSPRMESVLRPVAAKFGLVLEVKPEVPDTYAYVMAFEEPTPEQGEYTDGSSSDHVGSD